MKALTIKEPWATLIIDGYKEYEFRSWKTNYRGKLLIHSGLNIEYGAFKEFKSYNLKCNPGYIIGEVNLVDCIKVDEKLDSELTKRDKLIYGRKSHIGYYAWKLENIKKYKNPIPCKGKLGIWNYDKK